MSNLIYIFSKQNKSLIENYSFSPRKKRNNDCLQGKISMETVYCSFQNSFILLPHLSLTNGATSIRYLTETWFNALINCNLDNYNLYCMNREIARGGG
ncbi:hypothetical protein BpHYR1_003266, partial [Brachionus plicatilis]